MYVCIYIHTNINYSKTAKNFLPNHHACKRTPRTSRLVPLYRAWCGGRGDKMKMTSTVSLYSERKLGSSNESVRRMRVIVKIYVETWVHNAKILLPGYHTCYRTLHASGLVPSHRASRDGRGG